MGSPAPSPATARPCCVTLLPQFSSPPSLPEPESGEMKATEPLSPTPMVLLLRPTELPTPPTLLPHTPLTPGLTSPPSSSLSSVRRKREAIEDAGETNMVERMMDMYQAIIESEECLERVACDVGGLANDAGFDPTMAQLASVMIPNKYSKYMKQFASAKNCHKLKCGNLF